ncbi:peptidylprolyl isomerase [bacterium]|nr:peptidylprolyl isomerase [bacterium]
MNGYGTKKNKKIFDRRSLFFSVVILAMFAYSVSQQQAVKKIVETGPAGKTAYEVYRELGNKLKSEKMYRQAIEAYSNYLADPSLKNDVRANIHYIIGNLYFEDTLYREALSAYYAADIIGVPAPVASDLNIKIVNCLERLGRDFSAEYALQSRSALEPADTAKPEGEIVAEFSGKTITMRDLDEQLELLDEKTRQEFRDPQKKFQFLQQYLSQELLARKAAKMGYDTDTDILRRTDDIKKKFMIEKMVRNEFEQNVKLDPQDILNFYEANKEKYNQPAMVKIAHILVDTHERAETLLAQINQGADFFELAKTESADAVTKPAGGIVDSWLSLSQPAFKGTDYTELVKVALEKADYSIVRVVQDSMGYHLMKVLEIKPPVERDYQQAAQQVSQDYQMMKAQGLYHQMMENILKVEDVKIYQDRFIPDAHQQGTQQQPVNIQRLDQ